MLSRLQRLEAQYKGFVHLLGFFIFMVLFVTTLSSRRSARDEWSMERALRDRVARVHFDDGRGGDATIEDVFDTKDVWGWTIGLLRATYSIDADDLLFGEETTRASILAATKGADPDGTWNGGPAPEVLAFIQAQLPVQAAGIALQYATSSRWIVPEEERRALVAEVLSEEYRAALADAGLQTYLATRRGGAADDPTASQEELAAACFAGAHPSVVRSSITLLAASLHGVERMLLTGKTSPSVGASGWIHRNCRFVGGMVIGITRYPSGQCVERLVSTSGDMEGAQCVVPEAEADDEPAMSKAFVGGLSGKPILSLDVMDSSVSGAASVTQGASTASSSEDDGEDAAAAAVDPLLAQLLAAGPVVPDAIVDSVVSAPGDGTIATQSGDWRTLLDIGVYGLGRPVMECTLAGLAQEGALGFDAKQMDTSIAAFNGALDIFSQVTAEFGFSEGGVIETDVVGVTVAPPGLSFSARFVAARVIELLFTLTLIAYLVGEFIEMKQLGLAYWKSLWNWIDLASIAAMLLSSLVWYALVWSVRGWTPSMPDLSDPAAISLILQDQADMRLWADMSSAYSSLAAASLLLSAVRMFKYLRFHERISIVTRTLETAASELAHFFIVFALVAFLFAQWGVQLLGSKLVEFSTPQATLTTLLRSLLGDFDFDSISHDRGTLGEVFFWVWIALAYFILLNVLLAVLLDAFAEVQAAGRDTETICESMYMFVWPLLSQLPLPRCCPCSRCGCSSASSTVATMPAGSKYAANGDSEVQFAAEDAAESRSQGRPLFLYTPAIAKVLAEWAAAAKLRGETAALSDVSELLRDVTDSANIARIVRYFGEVASERTGADASDRYAHAQLRSMRRQLAGLRIAVRSMSKAVDARAGSGARTEY